MITEWIAVGAAVVAAVVGPAVSVIISKQQNRAAAAIARRQISASLISGNRQAWIDKLRDAIAEFQACCYQLGFRGTHVSDRAHDDEWRQRAIHLRSRVALFINPNEADHKRLLILIDQSLSVAAVGESGYQEMARVQAAITETAQRVLKSEWERVKLGEPDDVFDGQRLSSTKQVTIHAHDV